jgi:hypothetical protein
MVEGKGKDSQDNRAVPPCYKVRARRNREHCNTSVKGQVYTQHLAQQHQPQTVVRDMCCGAL